MKDSTYAFPNIMQSILLLVMIFVSHFFASKLFSFVENETLINLLSEVFKLILLLIFLSYMTKLGKIDKAQFKLKVPNGIVLLCGTLCAIFILFLPMSDISYFDETYLEDYVVDLITQRTNVFTFIAMCLLGPVFEELIFRGVILAGLLKRYSPTVAILLSSLLFGIGHISIVLPFVFGLFMGWLFFRTSNLIYCIIIHCFVNFIGFAMRYAVFSKRASIEDINKYLEINTLTKGVISLVIFCSCIFVLHFIMKKRTSNVSRQQ
ncbi:CPBP family intramembrane glutamic endopeptidase [Parapedobacter tibetensis]|uniref:CPBP family intramembrane glutamic endopeptidase n=1 Tax=Parapedobacter tibetensis TaxID=2972951 RepID=UPI00214D5BA6|nr:CPBP family intramembrane glutamic endopeptidase [Parapedobacter tibetensis]